MRAALGVKTKIEGLSHGKTWRKSVSGKEKAKHMRQATERCRRVTKKRRVVRDTIREIIGRENIVGPGPL